MRFLLDHDNESILSSSMRIDMSPTTHKLTLEFEDADNEGYDISMNSQVHGYDF